MRSAVAGSVDLQTEIRDARSRIDHRLDRLMLSDPGQRDLVKVAMREAVLLPGKRLRPLMTVLAARDLGFDGPAAVDAGCALELVHTASLLLDDLPCMDDATLRRGEQTIHLRYGEDVAVLASIGLLTQAYGLLAVAPMLTDVQRTQLVQILSDAVGVNGLVGGQYTDLRGADRRPNPADVVVTNDRKTGALFIAATEFACLVADAGEEARTHLRNFARELGRAFQIMDDMVDADGDEIAAGKDVRQDHGKVTMLSLLGRDAARRRLSGHVAGSLAALAALPGGPGRMAFLVRQTFGEAVEARRRAMGHHGTEAETSFAASAE
ncbi:polyprenyl synthetase family protein [Chthonobacter albigriseus]|uniref:polyprenyl synthetase family protein n=1 Tax=Chthonobacter albigriseus TaxID=1683161 RepID=UPI0015EEEB45|nr:polyprenyl synthetase family protein [Chthonobacter albigriseus]